MDGTDILAMDKFFPWLKSHFPVISQANMYFFSIGKNFLSGQKIFCPGRWTGHKNGLMGTIAHFHFEKRLFAHIKLVKNDLFYGNILFQEAKIRYNMV